MNRKRITFWLLIMVAILLSGCSVRTIDQMYCLPKRSEGYLNLQSAMDEAMVGLEYHAPISGSNQQPVQTADLDGDGDMEFLVFARGNDKKPLKILIFTNDKENYYLSDTIEGTGTAFDQVLYIRMGEKPGVNLVVGRQVSDQVLRPLSVYGMNNGRCEQIMTTGYSRFMSTDLNGNGKDEILVLRPGNDSSENGVAELYSMTDGIVERSQEVTMSEPVDSIKRIMVNRLNDGIPAVYVASDVNGTAIITDVYATLDGVFTNVSLSNESGTSVQTLRNYYVYADDVDMDGVLELPDLIPVQSALNESNENQHLIRWYAMNSDGSEVDKLYSYHNFLGGWYLKLDNHIAPNISVSQLGNSYEFSYLETNGKKTPLMSVFVFTGQQREEQAVEDNRFVLYRNESTVYAAHLEVASANYNITQDSLINAFHLIVENWNAGDA